MKKYYVYKLTDKFTNEFYFGSRGCFCEIADDPYMGSMSVWKPDKNNLIKEIIKDGFNSKDESIEFESNIIKENINNPLNRNYHIPNKRFHTDGSAGSLYKTKKILLEKAKEAGIEVKSKWGIEEQQQIYDILDKKNTSPKTGIKIYYVKLDSPDTNR